MKWLPNPFQGRENDSDQVLRELRNKFTHFLAILDQNNQVLKIMSDMEEKARGEYLFDMNYIRDSLAGIQNTVGAMIEEMIALGGEKYAGLRERYHDVGEEVERVLPTCRPIEPDQYTMPFDSLGRVRTCSVGGKNAQLGEMKVELGLPVPDGFAISVAAYGRFVQANKLQSHISRYLKKLDIRSYQDLVRVSNEIQKIVLACPVPDDLADAIRVSHTRLKIKYPHQRFSLNVPGDRLVERYREVLASKFTPQAIYYLLSHSLSEADMAMAVGCVAMVDAAAAGVVYTRNPIKPDDGCLLVNSIFGLGRYLVDGRLTPDVFHVSRGDKQVSQVRIAPKPIRLVMHPDGGTVEEAVPEDSQLKPSLSEEHLSLLAEYALQIEQHYDAPQDIEWALDHDGRLFLLQTRPLRVIAVTGSGREPDTSMYEAIRLGGTTVCPGAAAGEVYPVESVTDLPEVPDSAVLVTHRSFPGLVTAMTKASAIVVEVGGVASHMATLAREYRVPTITGVKDATAVTKGQMVTVDATVGAVYAGVQEALIAARSVEYDLFGDMPIFRLLNDILKRVSPLNLLHPTDVDFADDNCRTYHDIVRFTHQRAMEEMFTAAKDMEDSDEISVQLETDIPLRLNILCIDRRYSGRKSVKETEINSPPLSAFWGGVKTEGWPAPASSSSSNRYRSGALTTQTNGPGRTFSESGFAILSKEYMLLSLRMGYHFTTIEAVCTGDTNKNYVRMQHKEGGAALDRRVRRVNLICEVLTRMGFRHDGQGDFLDSTVAYLEQGSVRRILRLLGRLSMLTKQLDMALSNDAVARWYTDDILEKLELKREDWQRDE
jgi:pyruvate,water dikinase